MSEDHQTTNLTIQAIKPVGYFASLFQTAGRIVVSGVAFLFVLGLGSVTYKQIYNGTGFEGLLSGEGEVSLSDYENVSGNERSKNKFLTLELSGVILGTPPYPVQDPYFYSMYNVTFGYQLRDQILAAAEDKSIAGLFIHASTPGGTIFGSEAIFEGIKTYRETTKKPVVVWVEGMSASGGVYSTSGADAIYAAPGSAIGSIGVIGGAQVYYDRPTAIQSGMMSGGIVTEGGIEVTYMHAGRGKDAGNPYRRATDEEIAIRQASLDRSYKEFVRHVSEGRGIPAEKIVDTLGAHLYGNDQAEDYGLIDGTKSRDQAYEQLAAMVGFEEGEYQIVRRAPPRASILQDVLAEESARADVSSDVMGQVVAKIEGVKCDAARQISLVYEGPVEAICVKP